MSTSEAPIVPQEQAAIEADLYCVRCGYNLRTLSMSSLCPECSHPVEKSVLDDAQLNWLSGVRRGLTLMVVAGAAITIGGFALGTFAVLLGFFPSMAPTYIILYRIITVVGLLFSAAFPVGVFLATRRSAYLRPGFFPPLAAGVRIACILVLGLALLSTVFHLVLSYGTTSVQIAAAQILANFVQMVLVASYLYLLLVAFRIHRRFLFTLVLFLSVSLFVFGELSMFFQYQWLSFGAPGGGGPSPHQWMNWVVWGGHIAANGVCVVLYYSCRGAVDRLISNRPTAGPVRLPLS